MPDADEPQLPAELGEEGARLIGYMTAAHTRIMAELRAHVAQIAEPDERAAMVKVLDWCDLGVRVEAELILLLQALQRARERAQIKREGYSNPHAEQKRRQRQRERVQRRRIRHE